MSDDQKTYPTTCRMKVRQATIDAAMQEFRAMLTKQIEAKGDVAWASSHETLGVVTEEYTELVSAIRENHLPAVKNELLDIMVAAFWGIASAKQGAWTW